MQKIQHKEWAEFWNSQFTLPYFIELDQKLTEESKSQVIYPDEVDRFNAFESVAPKKVKLVIMGQDPYFNSDRNAMGLSFSIPKERTKLPSSLKNIRKELLRCYPDISLPVHGDLTGWAEQGVFMLNAVLSVREGEANSHAKKLGWEQFTRAALEYLSDVNDGFVFLAWGKYAHKLAQYIDQDKHVVIKTSHPSGLGHYRSGSDFNAFTESHCFIKANEALTRLGKPSVDWSDLN